MAFPMIETGYKPEFSLGALYQGENAAAAQNSQTQEIIKQALENIQKQAIFPIDVESRIANINKTNREAQPNPLQEAQAKSMGLEMFNPLVAAHLANKDEANFDLLAQDPNTPDSVKTGIKQLSPEYRRQFLEAYLKNMPVNQHVADIGKTNIRADADRNIAEMGVYNTKTKADTDLEIAKLHLDGVKYTADQHKAAADARASQDKTAKTVSEQGNEFYTQAVAAEQAGKTEEAAKLYARAQQFYNLALQVAAAGAQVTAGSKPDMGALNPKLSPRGSPTPQLPGPVQNLTPEQQAKRDKL